MIIAIINSKVVEINKSAYRTKQLPAAVTKVITNCSNIPYVILAEPSSAHVLHSLCIFFERIAKLLIGFDKL
jgi:hypothetical protein